MIWKQITGLFFWHYRQDFKRTAIERHDAASMRVIKEAAKSFGSPAATAIHPTEALQKNTAVKNVVEMRAARRAWGYRRSIRNPQNAERSPKVPPDRRAVFAPVGFDKNPAMPHRMRKSPKPKNQRPVKFIVCGSFKIVSDERKLDRSGCGYCF